MTTTNRFLNRLLLLVVGLVLLVVGGATAVGVLIPDARDAVSGAVDGAGSAVSSSLSGAPWVAWAAAAGCLLLIAVLLWFALRQGRGRTGTLLRVGASSATQGATPTGGDVIVDAKVASDLLSDALSRDPAIVALDVTAFRVRRQNVLRITAHARRGASPVAVRESIDRAVGEWDALLGRQTPVVIQIVSGLRSRVASTARVA